MIRHDSSAPMDLALYIGGRWRPAETRETFEVIDPATGACIARAPRGGPADVDAAVDAAQKVGANWRTDPVARGRLLARVAAAVHNQEEQLAYYESLNTGKPLRQARADVRIAARYFEYYSGLADKVHGLSIPSSADVVDFTVREPIGVVGQIVPWNYPLQILARGLAPALAAGNSVVVKPAEETPVTAYLLTKLLETVGCPAGAVNVVTGYGEEAGAALAAHPGIQALDFTGSREVGVSVTRAAAGNIVPVMLELGGKSPHIVFDDADLDRAVPIIVHALLQNAGQTCSAGTRLIVERAVFQEVTRRIVEAFRTVRTGHGLADPDLGPLISERQRARVQDLCVRGVQDGGEVAYGAQNLPGSGFFFAPTLLVDVPYHSRAVQEEIFGPVLVANGFDELTEAIELANGTTYGLVAGVWTRNIDTAMAMARAIEAGQVFINGYGAGGGVEFPFGGMRHSGFGRAKGSEAVLHYTRVKNVAIVTV